MNQNPNPPMRIPETDEPLDPMTNPEVDKLAQSIIDNANQSDPSQAGEAESPTLPFPNHEALHVDLPVGMYHPMRGEAVETAEVRELNGEDEEYFLRGKNLRERKARILERAVTRLGDEKPEPEVLMSMPSPDRETMLLAISRATYGDELTLTISCPRCAEKQTPTIDLASDIPVKKAEHITPKVTLPSGSVVVHRWQTGKDEAAIGEWIDRHPDANRGDINTMVIASIVESIDGVDIIGEDSARRLGLRIRSEIVDYLWEAQPGPSYTDLKHVCSSCNHEAILEVSFEDLFR